MIVIKVYLHFAFTSFHIELAKQQKVKNLSSTVSTLPSSFVFSLNCKKRKVEKRKLKRYVYLSYIDNHRKSKTQQYFITKATEGKVCISNCSINHVVAFLFSLIVFIFLKTFLTMLPFTRKRMSGNWINVSNI